MTMDETTINQQPELVETEPVAEQPQAVVEEPVAEPEPEPAANAEPAPAAEPDELTELRQALAQVGGVTGFMAAVAELRAHQDAERETLIAELSANAAVAFDRADLEGMETTVLRKLAQSVRIPPPSYAGRGAPQPQANASAKEETLAMPAFFLAPN